ncbi:MAG: DUF3035 domain-containing protein [Alphaproteobacteria bacterium]|nr:DUF3035 domain-containing protein [Alphaproteobacteria bacterium]
MQSRRILALALLATASATLGGCDTFRSASGIGKDSPDEFAVVTKAPLVIPPDFNLRPPAPGAAPTNQVEATQAAQAALFNADPSTVAASLPATMSEGERYLLANAHVQNADPSIRQAIASDVSGARATDDSFTSSVLFGGPSGSPGTAPVDADAEARRLENARANGTAPAPAGTAPAAPPPPPEDKGSSWWPF